MEAKTSQGAFFSSYRKYRYALWRIWDDTKPYVMFIGLNPSIANEIDNDPTIRRCINYSKGWGYGGVYMMNLFAYVGTNPHDMKNAQDPIGPKNNDWLHKISGNAGIIIASWGNDGLYLNRSYQIKKKLPKLHCLKINKNGEPAHPLYQKLNLKPIRFNY